MNTSIPRREDVMRKLGDLQTKNINDALERISSIVAKAVKVPIKIGDHEIPTLNDSVVFSAVEHQLKSSGWAIKKVSSDPKDGNGYFEIS